MGQTNLLDGWLLVFVGALLLAGYTAHLLGRRLHVPRVTLLIVIGFVSGPYVLNFVPETLSTWFPQVAHFALAMVGFLLGEGFIGKEFKRMGRIVIWMPFTYVLFAAVLVFFGTLAAAGSVVMALLLAGIAPASAPAATMDVIRETRAKGPVARALFRVVAIDDVYGVILFSLLLASAEGLMGERSAVLEVFWGLWDVVGAVMVGVAFGYPMAVLTGRLRKGEPAILEAAGFVFLCGGIAMVLEVSYLLACMVLGAVVANRAKHHTRPFHAIKDASDPFLAMFFLLAGYRLDLNAVAEIGVIGVVYVLMRSLGLIWGGRLGARLAQAPPVLQKHIGWCLLPQAGVALGLALLANEKLPGVGETLLPLIIATTILFEIVGPIFTLRHLSLAGELPDDRS